MLYGKRKRQITIKTISTSKKPIIARYSWFFLYCENENAPELAAGSLAPESRGKNSGNPGICSDRNAQRQNRAAEIQRVARVGVRPGHREDLLLVQVARGTSANEQSDGTQDRSARE